jgi:hypothetical protein
VTNHIGDMLDEAVAGLMPRTADPVGVVVRRGRAARRRTIAATATAFVLLAGGLTFLRPGSPAALPADPADGRPPVP